MAGKKRLDTLLHEQGLAPSLEAAGQLIMAGHVRVNGQRVVIPAALLPVNAQIELEPAPRFVSRAGEKLAAALEAFNIGISGKVCADVGASTGGFTDCLLQFGAQKVYAIDVGRGILDWKLRQHPKVTVMENTNARRIERLPSPIHVVTIDVSFISLKVLLPIIRGWFFSDSETEPETKCNIFTVLALIKPQFEAEREDVDRGRGVIRDPNIHRQVLVDIFKYALNTGYQAKGLIPSPVLGSKGNREFMAWLVWSNQVPTPPDE